MTVDDSGVERRDRGDQPKADRSTRSVGVGARLQQCRHRLGTAADSCGKQWRPPEEQAQAKREQAAKVPKKEQISVNVNDIVEELKIQDESGEVSTRLKEDLWNLLLKNKIQNL